MIARGEARKLKFLIIEDEPMLALEYEQLIEAEGHEVAAIAFDAPTAVRLAAERQPDCALVDMNLRDGPLGPHVAKVLTGELGIPVLFVTSERHSVPLDLPGVIGCLPKPFTGDMFIGTIRFVAALVSGRSVADAIPAPAGLLLPSVATRRPQGSRRD